MKDVFSRRFSELSNLLNAMPVRSNSGGDSSIPDEVWMRWATSAHSLIKAVFGEDGPHYVNFSKAFGNCAGWAHEINAMKGVFDSAMDDFNGGYVFNIELQVSGEVLGDFVGLARHALGEGHINVASVLACAALEDALKRYAFSLGLSVDGKDISEVIAALKSEGKLGGGQKAIVDQLPRIRNSALHANWDKIDSGTVASVLGFLELFLLKEFIDSK